MATDPEQVDRVLRAFDFSQKAAEECRGSNNSRRREIIEARSLNRDASDATLCVQKRKPFDILAERPSLIDGRGDWHSFETLVDEFVKAFAGSLPYLADTK